MVNANYVCADFLTLCILNALNLAKRVREKLFSAEYLVAASVCANFGELAVERADTYGHRVSKVNNECLGAVFTYVACNLAHHRYGTK